MPSEFALKSLETMDFRRVQSVGFSACATAIAAADWRKERDGQLEVKTTSRGAGMVVIGAGFQMQGKEENG